ncbi:MAG: hypothetical protein ACFFAE_22120, partial [Candidatus Hodarchaeota archaeon]
GIIFTQVSEKVLSNKWIESAANHFSLKTYGKIREDQQFITITSQYQIPTIDSLFGKMKCAKDFQSTAEGMIRDFKEVNIREVTENQYQYLKERIYSF